MTMINDFESLIQTKRFQHVLLEKQDEFIKQTAIDILNILHKKTKPLVIIYSGTMGSGKTTLTKLLNNHLQNTLILRLDDDRAREGQMFDRNYISIKDGTTVLSFPVNNGKEVILKAIDDNPNTEYLFLSEGQFLGTEYEINEIIEYAHSKGITVIFDCLSIFYNGRRVPNTRHIKKIADHSFNMWAADRFSSGKAEMPMRVVRIAEDGSLPDGKDNESATYYLGLSNEERQQIFRNIENSEFAQLLMTYEYGKRIYLVPSHPTLDAVYVAGQDNRYYSTSLEMCCKILNAAGLGEIAEIYMMIEDEERALEVPQEC